MGHVSNDWQSALDIAGAWRKDLEDSRYPGDGMTNLDPTFDAIWAALRSSRPTAVLRDLVVEWKGAGCTQSEATERLSRFLEQLPLDAEAEDNAIRDVLDDVTGYCSPNRRLFT